MKQLVGVIFIVFGAAMVAFRDRFSRANAAQNQVLLNGRGGGPKTLAYGRISNLIGGSIAVVIGILLVTGVMG